MEVEHFHGDEMQRMKIPRLSEQMFTFDITMEEKRERKAYVLNGI